MVMINTRKPRKRASGVTLRLITLALVATFFAIPSAHAQQNRNESSDSRDPAPSSGLPAEVAEAVSMFNRAGALLDQYRYSDAKKLYDEVLQRYPNWLAARFNRGLAHLNLEGQGGRQTGDSDRRLEMARDDFLAVLDADPDFVAARFMLGIYYQHLGQDDQAMECYRKVFEKDEEDPYVAYKYAEVLLRTGKQPEGIKLLEKVLELDPGFISATYRLAQQYQRTGRRDEARALLLRFSRLRTTELAGGVYVAGEAYGEAGKYYRALGPDNLPLSPSTSQPLKRIVFAPPPESLPDATQPWPVAGGSAELAGVVAGDWDGDGDLDLCLTGLDDRGAAALFFNGGDGGFTRGRQVTDQAITCWAGDVDNDGDDDLWIGRAAGDELWMNDGKGSFERAESPASVAGPDQITSLTRLWDYDSDGDVDLLAFRWQEGNIPAIGQIVPAASSLWNNNRDGSWTDNADELELAMADQAIAAVVADDFDNDRDLDLILFPAGDAPQRVWINDRVGAFHTADAASLGWSVTGVLSATAGDVNKDGNMDLVVFTRRGLRLLWNRGRFRFEEDEAFSRQFGRVGGSGGQLADMDNDGDLDLVVLDGLRRDGQRGPMILANHWPEREFVDVLAADPGNLLTAINVERGAGGVVADFTGNGCCDILLVPHAAKPVLLKNVTSSGHWIQLDLRGTTTNDKKTRSNNSAIGARVEIKTGAVLQQFTVGNVSGPVAQPPLRVHAGLGDNAKVDWLRVIWPDGVLQAELELPADKVTTITELQRKTSSCPYLFAWDGQRFRFVADFGGVGGLGYWVAPDTYAKPDPTEYVPIPVLAPLGDEYVLQCLTPLEEVTYFDQAELLAVDHPVGSLAVPHEMMAVAAAPPPPEVFCFDHRVLPLRARDHLGRDVTDALSRIDRDYAGCTHPDPRFHGLAREHTVELDFGDQLSRLDPARRWVLCLQGWVEYGYSSTNYAAYQAGLRPQAPSIDVWREGEWITVAREVGYPAGLNHMMTLDVTKLLKPSDRRLRIRSTMELYWDQIFLGQHLGRDAIRQHVAPVKSADLHYFGYPREYSPDGRQPNLCDYTNPDRTVAWKLMAGSYTRYGDVTPLLRKPDDCFAIMGHGDEITLRFSVDAFPPVRPGWQRSFILKTNSFCKDMDLATAFADTVEPLPFQGMSGYPYGENESYPDTEETRSYRNHYNTRVLGKEPKANERW